MTTGSDAQRERTLRTVLEAAPVGIGLVRNRILGWCNHRLEEMLGYTADELMGQSARILYPDQDEFERVARVKHPCVMAGGVGSVQTRMRRKDGRLLEVLLSSAALEPGSLDAGLIYTVLDLSDQKAAEARLLERERAIATLLANLPGMAYRCRNDENWTMEFLSEGCRELTGRPASVFLGSAEIAYADIIHQEDRPGVWLAIQDALNRHAPFELEYRIATPSGEKWVWERGRGVYDGAGDLIALEGLITDVTQRRSLEQRAMQSQRLEAIGQLAGGVAHDFNNLLQVINGYASMLQDDLDRGAGDSDHVAEIRKAGDRASALVRQLLAFGRRQVLTRTEVDLNELTSGLLAMLGRTIGENFVLQFHGDPTAGHVLADAAQIEQVLVNLCLNARDAMPGGGRLEIAIAEVQVDAAGAGGIEGIEPGRHVRLTVSDAGRGMPPEVAARVFEPFFTTKEVGEGSGLGLATVYGVVKQHGGGIVVQSQPGRGSRFEVYLPVSGRAVTARTGASPTPAPPPGCGESVLLAEDDPGVLGLATRILQSAGYRVLPARDGREALAVYGEHRDQVSLAVLDLVMPDCGGREVHEALRRDRPRLPILFCTGYAMEAIHPDFHLAAGTSLLEKPFDGPTLLRRVRELLDAFEPADGA